MIKKIFALTFSFFALSSTAYADNTPVVVELFTSQSCSSCPPADRVLGELAEKDNVIALSCNVTYWNHLHWKDTLSRGFCTDRQRDYARIKSKRGPYTPQVVINGDAETVGSRRGQVNKLVDSAKPIQAIEITPDQNAINIALPDLSDGDYKLLLFAFDGEHTQSIPSGENRGRTVTYTNPVSDLQNLGRWNGDTQIKTHKIGFGGAPSGGYAVIAQGRQGIIHAAGQLKL